VRVIDRRIAEMKKEVPLNESMAESFRTGRLHAYENNRRIEDTLMAAEYDAKARAAREHLDRLMEIKRKHSAVTR
jgi:hypothetical protein